ncbi:MAG TPA: hypothetical protein VI076_08915 [Actinopolymorphaceae bacterium]
MSERTNAEAHTTAAGVADRERRTTTVFRVVFVVAVVLSVFHYLDNWLRYDAYLVAPDVPAPPAVGIPLGWLVFTVAGVFGYIRFHQRRWWAAVGLLAIYSLSGLIGVFHYVGAPLSGFDWVQHVAILTDVAAGIAVLGFAIWLMFRRALPEFQAD